jgi:hypothetical protein
MKNDLRKTRWMQKAHELVKASIPDVETRKGPDYWDTMNYLLFKGYTPQDAAAKIIAGFKTV